MRQQLDELRAVKGIGIITLRRLETLRRNAPDAAAIVAAVQIQMLLDALRNAPRMLDGLAVHIGHVKAAIRRIGKLHGTKPVIARGNKLALALIGRPFAYRLHAGITHLFAMDQITAGIGNERVAAETFAQRVTAINRHAGRRREISGHPSAAFHRPAHLAGNTPARAHDAPGFIGAQSEHLRRRAISRNAHSLARQGIMPIAPGITRRIHQRLQMAAVAAGELAAVIVKAHAVLRCAVFRAQLECARVKRKIAAIQRHRFARRILHAAAHIRGAAMNAIIQPPPKAVEHRLHIQPAAAGAKALQHRAVYIRLTVTGGVLEKQNFRRHPHKHAAVVADHRRRPRQPLGKHRALFKTPVAIGILQPPNATGIRIASLRVADHLHHIQPPVRIKAHGNGIGHHRLRRRQLQIKSRLHLKRPARFRHRRVWYPRQLLRIRLRVSGQHHAHSQE